MTPNAHKNKGLITSRLKPNRKLRHRKNWKRKDSSLKKKLSNQSMGLSQMSTL